MQYKGPLYGKVDGKYILLEETAEDIETLRKTVEELREDAAKVCIRLINLDNRLIEHWRENTKLGEAYEAVMSQWKVVSEERDELRKQLENYETFHISQAQAAEWHTSLVEEESNNRIFATALDKILRLDESKGGIMKRIAQQAFEEVL